MSGILSKALVFSFFLLSTFYLLPSVTHANTTPQVNNYPVANTNPDVPNNLHNWTQNVMIEVMSALTCQLAGVDPINPKQGCLGIDSASGKIGFLQQGPAPNGAGGAIGFMGNMIATLYTPPLHTSDYFQNLASNFGINKKAYAQSAGGTGFQGLSPLIGVWSAFRNIVYLFLVIVFVVIGLAIMLRIKIDPRTVMSIQNQIPKIIIGILVVTFSFAIAGFLVDLMYVSIHLTGNIISSADKNLQDSGIVAQLASETNPFQAAGHVGREGGNATLGLKDIAWEPAKSVGGFISPIFDNTPGKLIIGLTMGFLGKAAAKPVEGIATGVGTVAGGILGALLGGGVGAVPGAAIGSSIGKFIGAILPVAGATGGALFAGEIVGAFVSLIAFLIIAIALLFALFRLWFTLIMAYVHILIDVVLAPFWIIGGIVPGSPISLSGWLRDISANLLAFPVTIAMFLLGKVFIDAFGTTQIKGEFVPPLIGNPAGTNAIGSLIGLGIILMTPNVVNMLKTALKAPKIDTGGVGRAIGAGAGAPMGIFRAGGNIGSTLFGLSNIPGVNKIPFLAKIKGSGTHPPSQGP